MNAFRTLLEHSEPAIGTWIKLPTVETAELMALAGFDFVVIDLEHSPMSMETASQLLAVTRGNGCATLVRLPDHSPAWVQRCLDAGAAGVIAPHVDSIEEAAALGRAARFPPLGSRGVGPTGRAGAWGMRPMTDYLGRGDETMLVAQIESKRAVAAAPEMLRLDLLDALLLGPADLSVELGESIESDAVAACTREVLAACSAAEVPCGIAIGSDPRRAAELARTGFSFVMVSNDATILGTAAAQLVERFREGRALYA